jgi:hypothetical protein
MLMHLFRISLLDLDLQRYTEFKSILSLSLIEFPNHVPSWDFLGNEKFPSRQRNLEISITGEPINLNLISYNMLKGRLVIHNVSEHCAHHSVPYFRK